MREDFNWTEGFCGVILFLKIGGNIDGATV
jgi:hypothetical protein